MSDSKVSRAAAIARRLQSPVVIMEEATEPVVIVPLSQYEEMIGKGHGKSLTQGNGSATIHRDIVLENPDETTRGQASGSGVSSAEGLDEHYYMEPLE